ncbi:nicotinamide riboside transporter PnuC [Nafulsella turpanensis]|uniref:nicotinamide riboside transporter PnuC n=1 Tax=Nafulsella turpanensis TaxID=1265690 RepID=UPI0003482097|nr:nicotinamide riboside transporter PnuC [Nafulsella turpanensis]
MNLQEFQLIIREALVAMTWLEGLAVLLGLTYVLLAARESIWCWPAAFLSVCIYVYLCLEARLYAETGLQIFYLIMAVVGWWSWSGRSKGPASAENSLPIIRWSLKTHLLIILANTAATLLLGWTLEVYTDAANPLLDSFTTVFSLFTTWMVTQKVLENWLYWVVIDAASVYLYASRDLYLTALLFLLYTVIAIAGYLRWQKQYQHQLSA